MGDHREGHTLQHSEGRASAKGVFLFIMGDTHSVTALYTLFPFLFPLHLIIMG